MEFIKKMFRGKNKKVIANLLIVLSIGVTLLIASQVLLKPRDGGEQANQTPNMVKETPPGGTVSPSSLETRMEEILSVVDGAGKVRVLVNYSRGTESVAARNETSDASLTSETDSSGGSREQSSEKNQSNVVTVRQNDGSEEPLILYENAPAVEGVIIVAEGGGDINVQNSLIRAASALLGIPVHKVTVLKMSSG